MYYRRCVRSRLLLAALALLLRCSVGLSHDAQAATFTVDRPDDNAGATACVDDATPEAGENCTDGIDNDGDGLVDGNDPDCDCSLRGAIIKANTTPGADTIVPAGTYNLTIAGAAEDGAARGDLDITGDLTLNGAGAATTIISGAADDRVFHVDPNGGNSNVSINGVTVQNGSTGVIAFVEATGGGILLGSTATAGDSTIPSGTLTLSDCVIQGNFSQGAGGGLANRRGTLVITRSRVTNNTSHTGGGEILNDVQNSQTTLIDSTVSNNMVDFGGNGGGILDQGVQLTVLSSTINGNTTPGQGGGP